jgi:hypothetical protein
MLLVTWLPGEEMQFEQEKGKSNGTDASAWEAHHDSPVWSVLLCGRRHHDEWGELGRLGLLDSHRDSDPGNLDRQRALSKGGVNMEAVKAAAQKYDFDLHRVPGKYFVLCDWYLALVAMFDDTSYGHSQAVEWMKSEKEEAPLSTPTTFAGNTSTSE